MNDKAVVQRLWRTLNRQSMTVDDWRDLHETIEGFKARFVARHAGRAVAETIEQAALRLGQDKLMTTQ